MGAINLGAASSVVHLQDNTSSLLANAAAVACVTANLNNGSNLGFNGHFRLTTNGWGATTSIAGKTIDLYLVAELDGAAFPEVDTTTPNLPAPAYVGSFEIIDTNSIQLLDLYGIRLGPFIYKAYIVNNSGQSMSAGWKLDAYTNAEAYT